PASPSNRQCSTFRKKRHIGAEPSSEVQELVSWDRVACERVHGVQCRGAVARAATESGANGNSLGQRNRYTESITRRLAHRKRRADGKIFIGGPEIWSIDLELHSRASPSDLQFVGE